MSDKEAYELMIEYCGGEKGILMIKEMIHLVGVDRAVENMVSVYNEAGKKTPFDFKLWMKQAFDYLNKLNINNTN